MIKANNVINIYIKHNFSNCGDIDNVLADLADK